MFELTPMNVKNFITAIIVLIVVIMAICMLQIYFVKKKLERTVANMSSLPSMPIIGHLYYIFTKIDEFFILLLSAMPVINRVTQPSKIWLGPYLYVSTMNPDHTKIILNHPKALDKDKFYQLCGNKSSILFSSGDVWKSKRKMVSPSFNQNLLNGFVKTFEENAYKLVNLLKTKQFNKNFDIYPFLINSNTRIIIETMFGTSYNFSDTPDAFNELYSRYFEIILERTKNPLYYLKFIYRHTKLYKEQKQINIDLGKFIAEFLQNRHDEYKKMKLDSNHSDDKTHQTEEINENIYKYGKKSKGIIDSLIELRDENLCSVNELFQQVNTFIIAGTETNALTTRYVLTMLGIYPEIQDKVYSEIMEVYGSANQNITMEYLSQLHYTEMVIKETMRLFPALPVILRQAQEDIKLDKEYTIPSGSGIVIPIFSIHRNPELWDNCLQFNPERFSFENNSNIIPYSFIPFSAGPRNCIGYKFAMMAMKTQIATFIRKYKVHCSHKSHLDIKLKYDLTLKPDDGTLISIEERT